MNSLRAKPAIDTEYEMRNLAALRHQGLMTA
jgi:hypothetical protein